MADIFELDWSAGGTKALVAAFHGVERLSAPYRFDVYVSLPPDDLPPATDALGTDVTLSLRPDEDGAPHWIHGIVAELGVVVPSEERVLIALAIVPRLWLLDQVRHSRVFTEQSVVDVIQAVLDDAGLAAGTDFELRLDGTYDPYRHICQYKESDLAFVSRWMEHEGLYYFFEHDEGAHKVIITDHRSFHDRGPDASVRYYPQAADRASRGDFYRFRCRRQLQPAGVKLSDYDYRNPDLDVTAEAEVADQTGAMVVEHGARFWTPAEGARLAGLRAEELIASGNQFEAAGPAFRLRTGYLFELAEHPRASRNREYLCVELRHFGRGRTATAELRRLTGMDGDAVYRVELRAIESTVQFRPPRTTDRPRVVGLERGTVDGALDSEYAQIDDHGRYRVKFSFDESALSGDASSVPIRMMQPHAGNPEGFHFPLRKGTEVLLGFIAGDPDRPVIVGAVHNAESPIPVTDANATRNMLRTGGENALEIQDEEGGQWCDWRSPTEDTYLHLGKPYNPTHYIVAHTNEDCLFKFGTDQKILVGGALDEQVTGSVTERYDTSQTSKITGDQTTRVSADVIEEYTGGQHTKVTDQVSEIYLSAQTSTVTGGRHERYEVGQNSLVVGGVTQHFDSAQDFTVNGPSFQVYGGAKRVMATGKLKYQFDSAVMQLFGPTTQIALTTDWTIRGASTLTTSRFLQASVMSDAKTGTVNELRSVLTNVTVMARALIGAKYEAGVVAMGATGLKMEATGAAFEMYGLKDDLKGINLDTSGLISTSAANQGET